MKPFKSLPKKLLLGVFAACVLAFAPWSRADDQTNSAQKNGNEAAVSAAIPAIKSELDTLNKKVDALGDVTNVLFQAVSQTLSTSLVRHDQILIAKMDAISNGLQLQIGNVAKAGKSADPTPAPTPGVAKPSQSAQWLTLAFVIVLLAVTLGLFSVTSSKIAESVAESKKVRLDMVNLGGQLDAKHKVIDDAAASLKAVAAEVAGNLERIEAAINERLEKVVEVANSSKLAELATGANGAVGEIARLHSETDVLQKFMSGLHERTDEWIAKFEHQTNNSLAKIESQKNSMDKVLWPEPFLDNTRLGAARKRIVERAIGGDGAAVALMLAVAQLHLALTRPDRDAASISEVLGRLGGLAYAFWKGEPGSSVDHAFDLAQLWGAEINKLLSAGNTSMSIRVIMPKSSFDMDSMLSEQSVTGTTFRVREPLSWAVVSKTGEQQKVVVTGKVITE